MLSDGAGKEGSRKRMFGLTRVRDIGDFMRNYQ